MAKLSKVCTRCKMDRQLDCFRKCAKSSDGLDYWCNECYRIYKRSWKMANLEKFKEHYREYYKNSETHRLKRAEWKRKNRDKAKTSRRKWETANKTKSIVERKIATYFRDDKKRPVILCFNCNAKYAKNYHHYDYNKPYEVIPLCDSCHQREHYGSAKIDTSKRMIMGDTFLMFT